jgi:DNA-binding CsgD family transcriptional regulator
LRKPDDDALQSLIAQARSPLSSQLGGPGGSMRAPRPSGGRPYEICVAPAAERLPALSLFRPAICVIITDPDRRNLPDNERLRATFNLTESEARLVTLLAGGETLRRAAEQLKITYGTARTRLAQVFQKTATRRQAELITLVLTTVAIG